MNHLISIVVPIYNKEPYLADCVESIRAQTYPKIEILLVDDGSTDASADICRDFCGKDARIRYLHQDNAGQNAARRTGAEAARGDFLIFVDADDIVSPGMCSLLMENMKKTNADFVHSAHQALVDGRLGIINNERPGVYTGREILETFFFEPGEIISRPQGRKQPSTALWATLFRTQDIREVLRTFDMRVRLSEDTACLLSMLITAKRVSYIPEVTYFYRQAEGSVSRVHAKDKVSRISYFGQFLVKCFRLAGMPMEDERIIDGMMLFLLIYYGLEYFDDYPGLFPFSSERPTGRIALYGAGLFGEEFYAKESSRFFIAGWYDRNFEHYREIGLDVQNPEEMQKEEFDVIIITIRRISTSRAVAADLRRKFPGMAIYMLSEEILSSEYTRKKLRDLRDCKSIEEEE